MASRIMNDRNRNIFPGQIIMACLLFSIGWLPLHAQRNILKFDRLSSERGLSDSYINCMMQDRQGLIWFGTRDGLNRYDGYTFTVYRPDMSDPGAISDGGVESLVEDLDGRIWIGTHDGGLNRFDKETGRFIHFVSDAGNPGSITAGSVTSLCNQGEYIWIATTGPGSRLCRLNRRTGTATRYAHSAAIPSSISSDQITGVACDRSGVVWIGTEKAGLNRANPNGDRFINGNLNRAYSADATGGIYRLGVDTDGTLWLWSHATLRWLDPDPAGGRCRTLIDSADKVRMGRIYAVHRDRAGTIWFGGSNGGAGILKPGGGAPIYAEHLPYDPNSLGSDRIYCIMEDRAGNLWFGGNNGISKFNHRNWNLQYYQYEPFAHDGSSVNTIRHIMEDRRGDLWIATESMGVSRLTPSSQATTRYLCVPGNPTTISDNTANFITEDSRGSIWIGTNSGMSRFDRRRGGFHRYPPGAPDGTHLPHSGVWSILEDRRGTLWIGTFGGLCILNRETDRFTYLPSSESGREGPVSDRVLTLYEDRAGNLWAGTDKGLSVRDINSGLWRHYVHSPADVSSLGNNRVWYIHEDRDGMLWLATSGGGVERLDPRTGRFTHYTEREGLAGNMACGILEDDHGRLWISTTRGISMMDRPTGTFRNYGLQDGFYIHEFHFKSCYRDARGYLYFGGANGIISFHPDSIGDNSYVPGIVLTSFKVFNSERVLNVSGSVPAAIHLEHDSNFFSFGFAALDFTNSRRNRYRYHLEGLDDRWWETDGEHPRADYTNVPPGEYRFRVQGSNSDGIWNEEGASIAVNIHPAYWQTIWFRGMIATLATAIVAGLIMARLRGIRRRGMLERRLVEYQLKALRSQMNPHFIFNSLNSILLFMLDHDIDAAHLYLTRFARLMRSTLEHSKSESVPLADELDALACYLQLEALRMDNAFSYTIDVAPEISAGGVMIPPMLIQPYAENAINHGLKPAGAGGILSIDIRREEEWIVCSITDNGIGRMRAAGAQRSAAHRSRGMAVTQERLEILSSLSRECYGLEVVDLTGETGAPMGTRVNIRIPASLHFHQTETNNSNGFDTRDYRG